MDLIEQALARGQKALSEYEGKLLLQSYGLPMVKEILAADTQEALEAARTIGYPVAVKFCSPEVAHKTEKALLELDMHDDRHVIEACRKLRAKSEGAEGDFLIQEMVKGSRELVMGMIRDPQFGVCVMFGLGGIFTEALGDVTFRVAPIVKRDALEMIEEIKSHNILKAIRGMKAADPGVLCSSLVALGNLGVEIDAVQEVDVNPLIVRRDGQPVGVDALVVLAGTSSEHPPGLH